MTTKSICAVLIGCLTFAIAEEEKEAPAKVAEVALEKSIQPRTEGAVWRYRSVIYDGEEMYSVGTAHEKVVKVVEIEGKKCYRIEYGWDYRTTANGSWRRR
jgi:glucan biosynthesis protein